jgi:hypothetical protein
VAIWCACPLPERYECWRRRHGRAGDPDDYGDLNDGCECHCHDIYEEADDE